MSTSDQDEQNLPQSDAGNSELPQEGKGSPVPKNDLKLLLGLGGVFSTIADGKSAQAEQSSGDESKAPDKTAAQGYNTAAQFWQSQLDWSEEETDTSATEQEPPISFPPSSAAAETPPESKLQTVPPLQGEQQSKPITEKHHMQDLPHSSATTVNYDIASPAAVTKALVKANSEATGKTSFQESSPTGAIDSLVSKLELQVSKASSRLLGQVDQIRLSLNAEIESILQKANESEQKDENSFTSAINKLYKSLEEFTEECRLRLSDTCATGRYATKQLLESHKTTISEKHVNELNALLTLSANVEREHNQLSHSAIADIGELIRNKSGEVQDLSGAINKSTSDISHENAEKLTARFERAKKRINEEIEAMEHASESLVSSLQSDLMALCERASDKLRSGEQEHITSLQQSVQIWERDLGLLLRFMIGTAIMPRLREHETTLLHMSDDLIRKFSLQCDERAQKRHKELDLVCSELHDQQQTIEADSVSTLQAILSQQQTLLEDICISSKDEIITSSEQGTSSVEETKKQILQLDKESSDLVQSSLQLDGDLISDRDNVVSNFQQLKQHHVGQLLVAIEQQCQQLNDRSQNEQAKCRATRDRYTESLKEECRLALSQIKDALHEAFDAIEQAQEKHLE